MPELISWKKAEMNIEVTEDELLSENTINIPKQQVPVKSESMTLLTKMNNNIQAMGESLERLNQSQRETRTLSVLQAESANKRRISVSEELDTEELQSDGEMLLENACKRQKTCAKVPPGCSGGQEVQDDTEDEDSLLIDIAESLTDSEKTAPKVADKLAEIVNSRWLSKLNVNALKEKQEKYARPVNCEKLLTPKVNPEIWAHLNRQTRAKEPQTVFDAVSPYSCWQHCCQSDRYVAESEK